MKILCFGVRITCLPRAGAQVAWLGVGPRPPVLIDAVYITHVSHFLSCGPSVKKASSVFLEESLHFRVRVVNIVTFV